MEDIDEITYYVQSLEPGQPLSKDEVRDGYQHFNDEKNAKQLADNATKHGLALEVLNQLAG